MNKDLNKNIYETVKIGFLNVHLDIMWYIGHFPRRQSKIETMRIMLHKSIKCLNKRSIDYSEITAYITAADFVTIRLKLSKSFLY